MIFEAVSRRTMIDAKGNDKEVNERFLVDNIELCSECEQKVLEFWNGENDVISVKQSKIREFVNERENDEQDIYLATIEDIFVNDDGEEKATKYVVGIFSDSIEKATKQVGEFMKQGLNDMRLTSIKKTKIVELLK